MECTQVQKKLKYLKQVNEHACSQQQTHTSDLFPDESIQSVSSSSSSFVLTHRTVDTEQDLSVWWMELRWQPSQADWGSLAWWVFVLAATLSDDISALWESQWHWKKKFEMERNMQYTISRCCISPLEQHGRNLFEYLRRWKFMDCAPVWKKLAHSYLL